MDDLDAATALLAETDDLIIGQGGVAAVDVADDIGIGLQNDILVDQPGAGERGPAGVNGALDPVLARPADHALRLLSGLDAAEADLAEQLDAGRGEVDEVLLLHALFDDRRAGVNLHPAWPKAIEDALAGDGEGLEADDVAGPARHVHLPGRDHRRHPAVEGAVDPVELALARRPVTRHRMDVAVDKTRTEGRPPGVDDGACPLDIHVLLPAEGGNAPVLGNERIRVENG